MDERKRDSIVAYLRRRMAEFGIELDDVAAAIAQDQIQQKPARYRSATGETWSGDGEMPQWLKQAISAGQSLEHFAINGAAQSVPAACPNVDWSQDPFAGSPLATVDLSHSGTR
ncbi:H-NS histone family protein [Paraburkholderia sp. CNPSo 3157]|uniref:H-NS histone family protein n=1 Tax=Paraburkholderia franconis TaxID=2654983 RepID=A0A7X1TKW2_9BURK|nr:H-NS histone family protein [Paraburkholderia franconis]MPW22991.1 H-NS histone family protein [Paraburkholderia franconis]